MPPRTNNVHDAQDYIPDLEPVTELKPETEQRRPFRRQIVWRNVALMVGLHVGALYGVYLCFVSAKWQTVVAGILMYIISGLGITAGAHRLWSHKAYKARLPLRIFLAYLQTMAFQNHIYEWSRDHRVHHKYSETDADPHNARNGFFFAHVGWLLSRKHPEVIEKGRNISMDDLLRDPVVRLQKKYYLYFVLVACFLVPTFIPVYFWSETIWNAYFICAIFRYALTLNMTWCINSVAHYWGRHPYDNNIYPAENYFTVYGAIGEGFHNYHHVFPWDYSASELGWRFNLTTMFINTMAVIGQAYDLKRVSPEMIVKRKMRTGDIAIYGNYGLYNPPPESSSATAGITHSEPSPAPSVATAINGVADAASASSAGHEKQN